MLLAIYLFLASLGFLFFGLAFYRQEQRMIFFSLAMVAFFTCSIASLNVI